MQDGQRCEQIKSAEAAGLGMYPSWLVASSYYEEISTAEEPRWDICVLVLALPWTKNLIPSKSPH